jgi:hypothetical protein
MSGANGQGPYASNYKQLVDKISKIIDAASKIPGAPPIGIQNGEIQVTHDGGPLAGKPFVTLKYEVNLSASPIEFKIIPPATIPLAPGVARTPVAGTTPAASPVATSQQVKDAANKIWVALEGNRFTEDEEAVYAVFRDDIKSDADLQSLLAYWASLKIPFKRGYSYRDWTNIEKSAEQFKVNSKYNESECSLQNFINQLFSAPEIGRVNDIIAKYSQFKF